VLILIFQKGAGVTYQTGQDIVLRPSFVNDGTLLNTQDTNFRPISQDWPVFALAVDLGQVSDTTSSPVVFALGLAPQNDAGCVRYVQPDQSLQDRYLYYLSETNTKDAVSYTILFDRDNLSIRLCEFSFKHSWQTIRMQKCGRMRSMLSC
jgi:Domain of unknown function (DUF5127)